uniref:PCI domain-containing protein n=1 Tax=Globodera pallida TaxID=36090 RepID=A0A183CIJ8_GLOPA
MENVVKKRLNKPINSVLQKRQKRLHSGGDGFTELLPKLKATSTKQDIINGLKELVGRTCATNADKFHLLQRRDVLLYKLRDIYSGAGGNRQMSQGTCPDMCPEKERYMRDAKKTVHFYEFSAQGQMVHDKMVKDYSRSAADQDTPLAHELRPLKTLHITMDYLIFNDITQQMLNNEMAVDLVEKCARLHIFASFRLVELEAELFDHKMNTENLSKSLQTLRHMYDDLAKKQIFCANEPEFRAYDILLNLSDFNVHSQVLSYRAVVRDDPKVQLALSLSSALQNNNYIRFFRLVQFQSAFLQACLSHHFFTMIRANALKVICMAYNIFPIDTFAEYLAFDSVDEALKFLQQFNLEMDVTDSNLINVREGRNFFAPGGEAPSADALQRTSCQWIKRKAQHLNLSQVLFNNPLAVRPDHLRDVPSPVDSFSRDNGAYVNDPVLKEFVELDCVTIATTRKNVRVEAPPNFSFARALQPFQTTFKPLRPIDTNNNDPLLALRENLINNVVLSTLSTIAEITLENSIRKNLRIRKAIRQWIFFVTKKRKQKIVNAFSSGMIGHIVSQQLQLCANNVFCAFRSDFCRRTALEIAVSQADFLLDKIVPKLLYSIGGRTRANKVRHTSERLQNIRENLQREWLRQFSDHWLSVVRRNRILRNITFLTNPGNGVAMLTLSPSQRLFRPNAKKVTPEQMREMAAEKMRQMEEERKSKKLRQIRENLQREWLRQFTNHWLSVVRRNRILRKITSLANPAGTETLSPPSQRLFRPNNVKKATSERMREMAAEKMRQMEEERKRMRGYY